jgi:competence protein ComEC
MIANHKGEIPFVILLIPFVAGIALGLNFGIYANTVILIIVLAILSAVFIGLNIGYKKFNIYKIRWMGGMLINLILFLAGWISIVNYSELNENSHFSKTTAQYLIARINSEPILKNGYYRFTTEVVETVNKNNKIAASGTLLIALKDSSAKNLSYGDELLVKSNYNTIDPPYNPAEFNYKQYLADKNIYYQQFLYPHQYLVLVHEAGNPIIAYALRMRRALVEKLKANMHDPDAVAVASTLILGYRADLSGDVLQAYSKTGTVYVLTVSGAQLAVIYFLMSFLLSFLLSFLSRHKYGKILRAIIIIGVLWYYALITGLSPAICRAALVLSMVIIGRTYNRYINTLNILAFSAFVLLLYDPYLLTEVGFQLAYLAVGGLIIFRPIVYKWLVFKNRIANWMWNVCAISIAAQAVTFPLSMFYFHQFPVYFLAANLLAVLPVAIIMYTGIIYLLLPQIAWLSKFLGYILEHTLLLMNKMLAFMEHLPFATIDKIWINTAEYLLLYAIIISLFYFLYDRKPLLLKISLVCILLLSVSISLKKINAQQSSSLTFLNLRKHVGIVMKNGDSAVVISDLADTDKNYKYSVQPYLDSNGVNDIKVYNLKQAMRSAFAAKYYDLVQFRNIKILICNGQADYNLLDKIFNPEYIYVTGETHQSISPVGNKPLRQTLVIDGSNSNRFLSDLLKQANRLQIKYHLLKRNNSYLAVSN